MFSNCWRNGKWQEQRAGKWERSISKALRGRCRNYWSSRRAKKRGIPNRRARSKGRGGQAGVRTDRGGRRGALAQRPRGARGTSRFHFHREFKTVTGVTPKAYAAQMQARRAASGCARRRRLSRRSTTPGLILRPLLRNVSGEAGYDADGSPAGRGEPSFASRSARGVSAPFWSPRRGRASARSRLETILTAWRAIFRTDFRGRSSSAAMPGSSGWSLAVGLVEPLGLGQLPVDVRGTAFQQRVWQALRAIPAG